MTCADVISVRLAPELSEALRQHSRQTGRALSDVVREALVAHLGAEVVAAHRPAPLHPQLVRELQELYGV